MREGLIAFTLGELGLLTAFVLTFAVGFERQRPVTLTPAEADSLRQVVNEQRRTREDDLRQIEALRDSVAALRSPQRPACQQVGLIEGYLVTARVVGRDEYVVEGDTLSISGVESRFAVQLEESTLRGCVHQVLALHAAGLPAETFVSAFNRLGQLFYVRAGNQP